MALTWTLVPLAWFWVASRVGDATGSLMAAVATILLGCLGATILVIRLLQRVDLVWVDLRHRAGHRQPEGALTQVVVISVTLALIAFYVWYYLLSDAYLLPFMPSN